jgi:hypothetical protein
MRNGPIGIFLALGLASLAAPGRPAPAYDPLVTFAPLAMPQAVNRYRSADGSPGPDYWQNRADYNITASLDAANKILSGEETISYANNSPDVLDVLWLQLDQNIYRRDSRGAAASSYFRSHFTDGFVLEQVEVDSGKGFAAAKYLVSDTRLQVRLAAPLRPAGGKVRVRIKYHYTVPGEFGGRTAWTATPNGEVFDIAQWYPRLAVYDDIRGWDTAPYVGNEFYLEYGSFDYAVTVPADMIVAGSGELANPADVLSPAQRQRLAAARSSETTVMIRTPEEVVATPAAQGTTKTWRFHMENTRDVAFAASRAFVWDAARIDLPGGRTALAQSVYPAESGGEAAWGRSTEYVKFAVEDFSRRWYPYPWPNAINVGGPVDAMEYPAVFFDAASDKGKVLFFYSVHEIGHTWFPMVVGFDERRHAWMDEGFNTFIDVYESDAFEGGVYGPKRDPEYAPGPQAPADQIAALIADPKAPPILTRADLIGQRYGHPVTYFKSAFGLTLLREDILGPERFDLAFRKFIADWAYKHPKPWDFFRAMESEGGEDLSWFWRGWYLENWSHDLAVTGVSYPSGDPAKGATLAIANLGQLVLPATMRLTFRDGKTRDIRIPVETWMQSGARTIDVDSDQPIARVVIDPDHRLPDADRSNNTWTAPAQ